MSLDYPRYLKAKESVFERALNKRVFASFLDRLEERSFEDPIRILELGGGIGSTVQRLFDRWTPRHVIYEIVDQSPENLSAARRHLNDYFQSRTFARSNRTRDRWVVETPKEQIDLRFKLKDAFEALESTNAQYDVVIAQAFLDLVNIDALLDALTPVMRSGALGYFPMHVNGHTSFTPSANPELDARIERIYHQSMDNRETPRGPAGGSRTGQQLIHALRHVDANVLGAGGSDWIVRADENGRYPADEAHFMRCMLGFFKDEMTKHDLGRNKVEGWMDARQRQLEAGSLVLVAHHLDVLAQFD